MMEKSNALHAKIMLQMEEMPMQMSTTKARVNDNDNRKSRHVEEMST